MSQVVTVVGGGLAGCEAALPIQPLRRGTIRITGLWLRWQGPLSLIQRKN